jgi:hypothetical protein
MTKQRGKTIEHSALGARAPEANEQHVIVADELVLSQDNIAALDAAQRDGQFQTTDGRRAMRLDIPEAAAITLTSGERWVYVYTSMAHRPQLMHWLPVARLHPESLNSWNFDRAYRLYGDISEPIRLELEAIFDRAKRWDVNERPTGEQDTAHRKMVSAAKIELSGAVVLENTGKGSVTEFVKLGAWLPVRRIGMQAQRRAAPEMRLYPNLSII